MRRRDRISIGIGGAALVTAVLVIGSALRWTQEIVLGLLALAVASQLFSRRRLDRVSPIVVFLAVAIGFTALQLVPLPPSVLDALNPTGNDLRERGAELAGTNPWRCLSMDPAGTLQSLCLLVGLLAVSLLTLRFAASERGRYVCLGGVALVCGLAAAITGVHTLLNTDVLYGVYAPVHATPPVLGPLLNGNHLGCLMAFGAVISLGLAFYERQATQLRVLWIVNGLGCVIVAFASLSRGAALGLVLGMLVTGVLLVSQRMAGPTERRRGLQRDLPVAIVVLVGVSLAIYASAGNVADQLDNTTLAEVNQPLSKFEAWRSSFTLVEETPYTGIGRGAFEPTFTRVHDQSAFATFTHPENEYVQAIVEWGVPAAIILGMLLARAAFAAVRRWRDGPLAAAALGAMSAVMFQSTVDFGVELLGLAVPVTIVASTLLIVPLRETSRPRRLWAPRLALVAACAAAALILGSRATRTVVEDNEALGDQKQPELADIQDVITRHPMNYFGYGQYALLANADGDERAMPLLNHALELHPTHPGLHRFAARRMIANRHLDQAAVEYAIAMNGTLAPKRLLAEILTLLPDAEHAAAAIPADFKDRDVILRALVELQRLDVSERWLARVVQRPQYDTKVFDALYDLAMARKDYEVAERAAHLRLKQVHTEQSRLMLAKVELARGEYEPILKDLADVATWHTRIDEQGDAWLVVCDVYIAQNDLDRAAHCLDQLDGKGILGMRRPLVVERLRDVHDRQEAIVKAKALQALEHSTTLPEVPIVHGQDPKPIAPPTIQNPLLRSPLLPKK